MGEDVGELRDFIETPKDFPIKALLEKLHTTSHGFKETYQPVLGTSPELLRGEVVLNFGSGNTNIGKELKELGVECTMVDLDILRYPHSLGRWILGLPFHKFAKLSFLNDKQADFFRKIARRAAKIESKQYVRYDGKNLPFSDKSFDHVLALTSTYLIPKEDREHVFKELMRVGKVIHISPIDKEDFEVLKRVTEESSYDIVICHSSKIGFDRLPVEFRSLEDYDDYISSNSEDERVNPPGSLLDKGTIVLRQR